MLSTSMLARDLPSTTGFHRALAGARVEAKRRADESVTPAHVLLALVREEGAARAGLVLSRLGIPPERLRAALDAAAADAPAYPGELPLDRAAKKVLGRCIACGRQTGRLTTEHLLLAIAEARSGLAAELLRWHGATPERVREAVAGLGADAGE